VVLEKGREMVVVVVLVHRTDALGRVYVSMKNLTKNERNKHYSYVLPNINCTQAANHPPPADGMVPFAAA